MGYGHGIWKRPVRRSIASDCWASTTQPNLQCYEILGEEVVARIIGTDVTRRYDLVARNKKDQSIMAVEVKTTRTGNIKPVASQLLFDALAARGYAIFQNLGPIPGPDEITYAKYGFGPASGKPIFDARADNLLLLLNSLGIAGTKEYRTRRLSDER